MSQSTNESLNLNESPINNSDKKKKESGRQSFGIQDSKDETNSIQYLQHIKSESDGQVPQSNL